MKLKDIDFRGVLELHKNGKTRCVADSFGIGFKINFLGYGYQNIVNGKITRILYNKTEKSFI